MFITVRSSLRVSPQPFAFSISVLTYLLEIRKLFSMDANEVQAKESFRDIVICRCIITYCSSIGFSEIDMTLGDNACVSCASEYFERSGTHFEERDR